MKKIILLGLLFSQISISHEEEGTGGAPANSTNATATEYIILLCTVPDGSVIDAKQSNSEAEEAAYTPECSARASLEGTQGQVVRSN